MTVRELADYLDPAMSAAQVSALIAVAGIQPSGVRYNRRPGHPFRTFSGAAVRAEHAREACRTVKRFADTDWLASAMLARGVILADTAAGELRWPDGTRAETVLQSGYAVVRASPLSVPAHRVIWIAADGEIPPGLQINHANRIRLDNRRANLELVTHHSNLLHRDGQEYLTYHEAVRQLAELRAHPELPEPPAEDIGEQQFIRVGGVFRPARYHEPG
jgi:hypothetical protein